MSNLVAQSASFLRDWRAVGLAGVARHKVADHSVAAGLVARMDKSFEALPKPGRFAEADHRFEKPSLLECGAGATLFHALSRCAEDPRRAASVAQALASPCGYDAIQGRWTLIRESFQAILDYARLRDMSPSFTELSHGFKRQRDAMPELYAGRGGAEALALSMDALSQVVAPAWAQVWGENWLEATITQHSQYGGMFSCLAHQMLSNRIPGNNERFESFLVRLDDVAIERAHHATHWVFGGAVLMPWKATMQMLMEREGEQIAAVARQPDPSKSKPFRL